MMHRHVTGKIFFGESSMFISLFAFFLLIMVHASSSPAAEGDVTFPDQEVSLSDLQQHLDKGGPGVVMIIVYDDTGVERDRGSGFFIDKDGRILTNAEIVQDAYSAEVFSDAHHYKEVTLLNVNAELDLALLKVKAKKEMSLTLDFSQPVGIHDEVVILGKKEYFKKTISIGTIESMSSTSDAHVVMNIKIKPSPGNFEPSNDGPVLSMDGNIIGLVTKKKPESPLHEGTVSTYPTRDFSATGLEAINIFFQEQQAPVVLNAPKSRVWSSWISKTVKSYVFTALIYFYGLQTKFILGILFILVLLIVLLNWIYSKVKTRGR